MKIPFQNTEISIYLAENLDYLLTTRGLSYSQFLQQIEEDVPTGQVVLWTSGKEIPSIEIIVKMAMVLSVSLNELIAINLKLRDEAITGNLERE